MEEAKVKQNIYKYKLTDAQVDICLRNWWRLLEIKSATCIFRGRPLYSKYNTNRFNIAHHTRFADRYTVYRCEGNQYGILFFIIIDTNHFDKIELSVCSWFNHLIEPYIVPGNLTRPQIFICTMSELSDNNYKKISESMFINPYRVCSLWDLYTIIGSHTGNFGYTSDYKLIDNLPVEYNGRDYAYISTYDPFVKVINAIPGDVIEYKRIINECSPYIEVMRRRVVDNGLSTTVVGYFQGIADKDFYRDYEIDAFYKPINRPAYIGPTNVKNMGEWPKNPPIMEKEEYYTILKELSPSHYEYILKEDKHRAENFASFKKEIKRKNVDELTDEMNDTAVDDEQQEAVDEDSSEDEELIQASSSDDEYEASEGDDRDLKDEDVNENAVDDE